jgi:hypothetical protein
MEKALSRTISVASGSLKLEFAMDRRKSVAFVDIHPPILAISSG